jgi:para-aminobenzoate synthetase component 1
MYKDQARHIMNKWSNEKRPFMFMVDFEMKKIKVYPIDTMQNEVLFDFNGFRNFENYFINNIKPEFKHKGLNKKNYEKAFKKVHDELGYGNTFLINLTMKAEVESSFNLKELFFYSQAKYKLYYKGEFIFFSPESFIKIKNNTISSFPMKGTIDASTPDAKNMILNDKKEKAEHNTIVDLIRNDLSIVAKNVIVPRFRYIDKIESNNHSILQVSSEITGELKEQYKSNLGDLLFKLLPAGSISGAPKPKTVEIIKNVEETERGYYTGICGIFNGCDVDSCVMIRYIEKEGNKLFYRSGGGITHLSEQQSEYNEILQKIYVPTH